MSADEPHLIPNGSTFHVSSIAYTVVNFLGKGTFGEVYKVTTEQYNDNKKVINEYAMKVGCLRKYYEQQIKNEILIYNHIDHFFTNDQKKYLGKLIDQTEFTDDNKQRWSIMILEYYHISLLNLLSLRNYRGTDLYRVQQFLRAIVSGIKALHDNGIIHTDIKPDNIMIDRGSNPKIIDFGAAVFQDNEDLPNYVQSRYYRAPEIFLKLPAGSAVDIWSLGCVAAELHFGLPIFAGSSDIHMLQLMEARLGKFPQHMIENSPRQIDLFDGEVVKNDNPGVVIDPCKYLNTKLEKLVFLTSFRTPREVIEQFLDFLLCCLCFDPEKRMTINQLSDHEFLFMSISQPEI